MEMANFPLKIILMAVLMAWIGGCRPALLPFDEHVPAQALSYIGAPPIKDGRFRFRSIFCGLNDRLKHKVCVSDGCDDALWRLGDEAHASRVKSNLPSHDTDLTILIVPGAFSDCFGDIGRPYHEAAERLRRMGYRIVNIPVGGLASSTSNAATIAATVSEQRMMPNRQLVMIGYSKGIVDILHFLVDYPEQARSVAAVISVAGAVNGSPLADRYSGADYDNWLVGMFPGGCDAKDRGVLDSLSRINQFRWLSSHALPEHVRYYSLGSFARYQDVQTYLRPTYKSLEKIHPLNDGQLLFIDQLIPGSTLLGYVNADHWTIALPVEEVFSIRDSALKARDRQLRVLLFEAMILYLVEDLREL